MGSRITVKGQVTIPLAVRKALKLEPGDELQFELGAGGVHVTKVVDTERYQAILDDVRRRKPIRDITTDELMKELRGD